MTRPIGLAVIGTGAIAEQHMRAFERLGGIAPRCVVSRQPEAAQEFARRWKFEKVAASVQEAVDDPGVELVLITSPSPRHCGQTMESLMADKDVIVEIPVALSWLESKGVAEVADGLGRKVWVCQTMRSYAALREVRRRVQSEQIHITHIAGFYGIPRRRNQGMGGVGTRSWVDNLLWHHGCHQVDASLWVLGMPPVPRVQGLFGPKHPALGMTLDVGVQLVTAGGELITHALTYNLEKFAWQLKFIGHDDVLTYENGRLTSEVGEVLVPETPLTDLKVQNGELLQAFHSGEKSEFDLASVLPSMEVLGRAQRSAESTL